MEDEYSIDNARWLDEAKRAVLKEGGEIIFACADGEYSGYAVMLSKSPDGYRVIDWSYGSCPHCDDYEGLSKGLIQEAFDRLVVHTASLETLVRYGEKLNPSQYNVPLFRLKKFILNMGEQC